MKFTMSTLLPRTDRRPGNAILAGAFAFVFAAPILVVLTIGYRSLFAWEAWGLGTLYLPEDLEFLIPSKILATLKWVYVVTAPPAFITAAAIAWRTWKRRFLSYTWIALLAGSTMAIFMGLVAVVYRHEDISVVTPGTMVGGVFGAMIVYMIIRFALEQLGIVTASIK
jgi:hypothetical protein